MLFPPVMVQQPEACFLPAGAPGQRQSGFKVSISPLALVSLIRRTGYGTNSVAFLHMAIFLRIDHGSRVGEQ